MNKVSGRSSVSAVIVTRNRKVELEACLKSLVNSSYKISEIIIVDNGSDISVSSWLKNKFSSVKILRSEINVGAAAGRNIGIRNSRSDYLFFMDDDAIADVDTISNLLDVFKKNKKAAIVQPKVYDMEKRSYIQGVGHKIDLLTGRAKAWGLMEKDKGQYDYLREVPMTGGICLVRADLFRKIGLFDEIYFIPYEDSDLCIRATKAGYKVYCSGSAKSWHQGKKSTSVNPVLEWLGITLPERAYRIARNKIIFMRKHAPLLNFIIFILFITPVFSFIHTILISSSGKFEILFSYWKGLFSGLCYCIKPVEETRL